MHTHARTYARARARSLSHILSLSHTHTRTHARSQNTDLKDVGNNKQAHVLSEFVAQVLKEGARGREVSVPVKRSSSSAVTRRKTESSLVSTIAQLRATQVQAYGCRVWALGFSFDASGFEAQGFRLWGLGFQGVRAGSALAARTHGCMRACTVALHACPPSLSSRHLNSPMFNP